jgi:hypothetical protein
MGIFAIRLPARVVWDKLQRRSLALVGWQVCF